MNRRDCMALLVGATAGAAPSAVAAEPPDPSSWELWKSAFLSVDGRVIDHIQEGASHSEGQGYGLLLAEWFGDTDAFKRIFDWTEANLAVRDDPLLAWRWRPTETPQITDYNNASDGDLFYAWALARGAARFDLPIYAARAKAIARFLSDACLRPDPRFPQRLLFLPATEGFSDGISVTVNPAYIMPLAMRELGLATDTPVWVRAAGDGEEFLAEIAVAGLTPDWITVTPKGWGPSPKHAQTSGYEAVRCTLFLIWSGNVHHPTVLHAAAIYLATRKGRGTPVVFDVPGDVPRLSSDHPGYGAIAALVQCALPSPAFTADQPYYPATLHLFTQLARRVAVYGRRTCP
jgi:endo-1,4-beta-D-glucanase Y